MCQLGHALPAGSPSGCSNAPQGRVLAPAAPHEVGQLRGAARGHLWAQLVLRNLHDDLHGCHPGVELLGGPRGRRRGQLPSHNSQREDVGALGELALGQQLGGCVACRAKALRWVGGRRGHSRQEGT
jgi:hypothetical protein